MQDHLDNLLTAPMYIERAILSENDPFILNDEGMNLNQIKKGEQLIKDKSDTAWLVGYLAKSAGGADISIQAASEDIVGGYTTLSAIASDLGTTEGVLSTRSSANCPGSVIGRGVSLCMTNNTQLEFTCCTSLIVKSTRTFFIKLCYKIYLPY